MLKHHNHLDNSCELDSEKIPYRWDIKWTVLEDMKKYYTVTDLSLKYPEFEFQIVESLEVAKNFELRFNIKKGKWICANWKK